MVSHIRYSLNVLSRKCIRFQQKLTIVEKLMVYTHAHTKSSSSTHASKHANMEKFSADQIAALREEIAALRKENQEMKKRTHIPLKLEVTERNQVAITFNKYQVRLYKNQWLKILDQQQELRDFVEVNEHLLD